MVAPWVKEEVETADFGDKRLSERFESTLSDLGERPTASIPAACGGYAEMTATYRFFGNEKVTPERILAPHVHSTLKRVAAQPVALLVQDTSEIDLTRPQQQVAGAGPLDNGARRGVFLHLVEAFSPDGTPLGAVAAELHNRDENERNAQTNKDDAEASADGKRNYKREPIEQKESFRWLDGLRRAREVAEQSPETTCVYVADSEADIYELFAEPRGESNRLHWIIRASQDRALTRSDDDTMKCIRAAVSRTPVRFSFQVNVRARQAKVSCEHRRRRQPRKRRTAVVEVRAATVTLRPPYRPDRRLPPVTVNVVYVREVDPPEGEEPIEWILLTTLPIDTDEQIREILSYYTTRWSIEVLFRTFKSGCRVQQRRFEDIDRLLPCAMLYLIVAWRTQFVCQLGRTCPDAPSTVVFEPAEWKSAWAATHREKPPPTPPSLSEMVRLVAQLGGYVNRPDRKDPPGTQTLWLGLQRVHDLAMAWTTFGPGAPAGFV